jgi:hypothetical protein
MLAAKFEMRVTAIFRLDEGRVAIRNGRYRRREVFLLVRKHCRAMLKAN